MTVAFSSYYALISTVIFLRMRNEEKPSKKLSENCKGDLPVLQGFSPSNIKYMRQFFGEANSAIIFRYFRSAGHNLLVNSSVFVRLQAFVAIVEDIVNLN